MSDKKFCTRPSRLFSGNPSALFGPDAQYQSVAGPVTPTLSTPFQYQFDTNQVPDSEFWHIDKIALSIFNPTTNIAPNTDLILLMLMPNNLVGSTTQDDSGDVSGVNPNNLGLLIPQSVTDLINGVTGGFQEIFYDGLPIELPPRWFMRVAILDDGSGLQLPAGTQVTLRFMQQKIPVDFATR